MSPVTTQKPPIMTVDSYPDGTPCFVLEDPNVDGCLVYASSPSEAAKKLMALREQLTGVDIASWQSAPRVSGAMSPDPTFPQFVAA